MASVKFTVFLFICLHGSVLTSAEVLQTFPDDLSLGDTCQDCTQIFKLLADLLSNSSLQKKMIGDLENLCDHLPGPTSVAKVCREEVEKMLPIVISLLTSAMKPEQVCSVLGLCGSGDEEKLLISSVREALKGALALEKVQPPQCALCIFLFQSLESLLPKERTASAVLKLLEQICVILPSSYRDQCESLIGKYGRMVLDAILPYLTPQSICSLIHLCKGQEAALLEKAPQDPCTLRYYMCRDFKTAFKCGTVPFCQRFVWKSFTNNNL